MLQSLLTGNGYEVVTAKNGKEALDLARQSTPDLIISDILMPVMDGFTLCRQWMRDPKLREIPFVFYTATYTEPQDEQLALSLGADAFIVKPIETDAFLNLVQEAITRHGRMERRRMTVIPPDETAYLREYNGVLIRKLEDKLGQLENANKALAIKDFAIESSINGIIMADLSGILTYVNDSFSTMWGFVKSELYGKRLGDLVKDTNALRSISKEFEEKAGWLGEVEAKRKDGSTFVALVAAHSIMDRGDQPIGLMVSCIDVTERKQMQEELQRKQKLESLSVFAGGIAHDFNNLLTGIFGNVQLARKELPATSAAGKYLDEVTCVFQRARNLAQQLLTYAKGSSPEMGEANVQAILRECCDLSLSGSNIRYKFESADSLWTVKADANQLSQVFNNMVINARQAMANGGTLVISIENCNLEANQIGQLPSGKYVQIAIRDEGAGIPKEMIAKVFDPFFTTKPQGSGLGLATSYAIVKYHGGHIGVSSAPGAGSTFTVWLPAYTGIRTEPSPENSDESLYGDGRILVMDDESVIRHLVERMLRKAGYDPVAVKNGAEALESYRLATSRGESFDAVILDLTIRGGMGGVETASELLKMDPNAAIMMSSGYSSDPVVSKLKAIGCFALIPKPYLMHDLLGTVKSVIAQRRQRLGVTG
jgi:PAS domain S-box-containing protein